MIFHYIIISLQQIFPIKRINSIIPPQLRHIVAVVVIIHPGHGVFILTWEAEVAGDCWGTFERIYLAKRLIGRVPDNIPVIISHHLGRSEVVVVVEINGLGIAQCGFCLIHGDYNYSASAD